MGDYLKHGVWHIKSRRYLNCTVEANYNVILNLNVLSAEIVMLCDVNTLHVRNFQVK